MACALWCSVLPAAAERGWKLEQTSDYYGRQTVYLGKRGAVVVLEQLGVTWQVIGPRWRFRGFNTRARTYIDQDYMQWRKSHPVLEGKATAGTQKRVGQDVVAGLRVEKYYFDDPGRALVNPNAKVKQPGAGDRLYNTAAWFARDIEPPLPVAELMMAAFRGSGGLGVPVRVVQFNSTGKTLTAMDTLRSQPFEINAALFKVPHGYKRVSDEMILMLDQGADSEFAELLGDGFAERKSASPPLKPVGAANARSAKGGPGSSSR